MKRFQLSLSTMLVGMAIAAAAMACVAQLVSPRRQSLVEIAMLIAWSLSFTIAFARSKAIGWRRLGISSLIACEVWILGILATHLVYLIPVKTHAFQTADIVLRALSLIALGCALTLCLAAAAWAIRVVARFLVATPRRGLAAAIGTTSLGAAFAFMVATRSAPRDAWSPTISKRSATYSSDYGGDVEGFLGESYPTKDGRLVAVLNGPTLTVFETSSRNVVIEFRADPAYRFSSATFLSDGSYLFAVQSARDGSVSLLKWNTMTWNKESQVQMTQLADEVEIGNLTPVLAGDFLVLAQIRNSATGRTGLSLATIDLKDREWTRTPFEPVDLRLDERRQAAHVYPNSSKWYASPTGEFVVSDADVFNPRHRSLFRRDSDETSLLPPKVFGFAPESDFLVGREESVRRVFKTGRTEIDHPPFWNYLRGETQHRVFVIDCDSGHRLAQSPWLACSTPRFDAASQQITADYGKQLLSWDVRRIPGVGDRSPSTGTLRN